MAGSFNHIVSEDGRFTMDYIDNLGDAHEALEECFALIYALAGGDTSRISHACDELDLVDPWDSSHDDEQKIP